MFKPTKAVFDIIKTIPDIGKFTMVGGVAIAEHCQHRLSGDLDFACTDETLDRKAVSRVIQKLMKSCHVELADTIGDIHDAIHAGVDLGASQQNYMVNGVRVNFFRYGQSKTERKMLRSARKIKVDQIPVLDIHTLFRTKALLITDRIRSRDLFDLWWMINNLDYEIKDIVMTIKQYRTHIPYEQIRYRLIDWPLPKTDEGFEATIKSDVDIETIRNDIRRMVDKFEINATSLILKARHWIR